MNERETIEQVLGMKRWAVVGATPNDWKPSGYVTEFLIDNGYDVVPVNPEFDEVLGRTCYPDLASVPGAIDVVDMFRRSNVVGRHVDEAIEAGATAVWLQMGVVDQAAASRAEEAGLKVVMDRCPKVEIPRMASRRAS